MKEKIVIVGGVAGGASAAARMRRLDEEAEIVLFERGGDISYANCGMPYYIGGVIREREELLLQTPESLKARFNVNVCTHCEVLSIDPQKKVVSVRNLERGETWNEPYDKLILSPGVAPIRPDFPGSTLDCVYTLRTMQDCDSLKKQVAERGVTTALVVGGGFIGIELAENLVHSGVQVTLAELSGQVMPPLDGEMASFLHSEMRAAGVTLLLGKGLAAVERREDGAVLAHLTDGSTVETEMVILAIGVQPDSGLAERAGLRLGLKNAIRTDDMMRTSEADIFAVGDAAEVRDFVTGAAAVVPLAGPANRQGRIAASVAAGREFHYRGTLGTSICKVFGLTAASAGQNEKSLRRQGLQYDKVYTHPGSHAGYYPDSQTMHIKLLFAPDSGRILGAQIVGQEGVDKRIDVLATALYAGLTVEDLENLELAYAPPFSSAKDPVNLAGFVAANVRRGDLKQVFAEELFQLDPERDFLLDVRTADEVAEGALPGACNIPLDELRERLGELPAERRILVYCRVGLRGYVACRILMQKGFDAYNISGGFLTAKEAGLIP